MSDFIIMDREGVVPSREKRIKRIKGDMKRKKVKPISRSTFYRKVEVATGYRYEEIRFVLDVAFTLLGRELCNRVAVRIPNFGTFEPFKTSRSQYRGFDDKIHELDSKYTPKFRASSVLQDAVREGEPMTFSVTEIEEDSY